MKTAMAKQTGIILMCLGFTALFLGCSKSSDTQGDRNVGYQYWMGSVLGGVKNIDTKYYMGGDSDNSAFNMIPK